MSDKDSKSHLIPKTTWEKLYFFTFFFCFLMVYVGTWFVNKPIPILGMPLVFVWCSGWGLIWLISCCYFGIKILNESKKIKGE
ncbi:MAG: hypothetical protein CBC38_05820 [Gammaproteobacteria bacterium TMED78]|nr:MAG: hypothetical protein CBC38_05820 [Gammaproteobacteria bacterium TMED78]|tara:strand:- start:19532 stop:19780 length:249 start_codon:yes stop_codon:yes gene_type:complete